MDLPKNTRIVLPSPNGSTLTLATDGTPTFAGCLRNCRAVAKAAMRRGGRVSIIPAGERWKDDNSLRPAYEDLIGAGAIISHLDGSRSPESEAAVAAYMHSLGDLKTLLRNCASGQELIELGFGGDIDIIAEFDISECAPLLRDGAYVRSDERIEGG